MKPLHCWALAFQVYSSFSLLFNSTIFYLSYISSSYRSPWEGLTPAVLIMWPNLYFVSVFFYPLFRTHITWKGADFIRWGEQSICFTDICKTTQIYLDTKHSLLLRKVHFKLSINFIPNLVIIWMWINIRSKWLLFQVGFGRKLFIRNPMFVYWADFDYLTPLTGKLVLISRTFRLEVKFAD